MKAFQWSANKIVANQMSDISLENWNWIKLQINGSKDYTVCMEGLGANGQWSTQLFKYTQKIKNNQRKAQNTMICTAKWFPSIKLTENIPTNKSKLIHSFI